MEHRQAIVVLEDGRVFRGSPMGAVGEALGEVVFNTSMTGYQEIVSDPSYCGQIVAFTSVQIGNYGVCDDDDQAPWPSLSGVIVRELSAIDSSYRSLGTFDEWLQKRGIIGITEVDTRALTRHIREQGAMRAGIFSRDHSSDKALEKVLASPALSGRDLTGRVTTKEPYVFVPKTNKYKRVALVDFGVKRGILRSLTGRGIEVEVLPAGSAPEAVLGLGVDGLVLSNGPGDPAAVETGIRTASQLIGRLPVLGICLGYQILALAMGAKTYKMRFGHHGGNHPVRNELNGQVWITAQNHGFAVDPKSLPPGKVELTHTSLYDGTLEGFSAPELGLIAVQFHPEGCPGPSDAAAVFDRFSDTLEHWSPHAQA
jgi:carbamoyl-phosphate synthase small subunit